MTAVPALDSATAYVTVVYGDITAGAARGGDKMSKQRNDPVDNAGEVFSKETGDKSEKRYRNIQYLHLAVKALAAFILGIFVMYILKLS